MTRKTYVDFMQEMYDAAEASNQAALAENKRRDDMVAWLDDKLNNSEDDVDTVRAAFKKKFGNKAVSEFESLLDELM